MTEMIYERTETEYREIFDECDRDEDGYVTENDLYEVLSMKFQNLNMKLFHQLFIQFDADEDGRLNFKGCFTYIKRIT